MKILEEEDFSDYFELLEKIRNTLGNLDSIQNPEERENIVHEIISSSIKYSEDVSESGDYFEAADFIQSVAELLEEYDFDEALELYKRTIENWEKLIDVFAIQAKLHEIAEIYLKIADLYGEKFEDYDLERKVILKSIKYLIDESAILKEFGEIRRFVQNISNIGELYHKIQDYKNAIGSYEDVVKLAKENEFIDLLSYSYQQIAECHEELDDYTSAKENMLDGIDYFTKLYNIVDEKNEHLSIAQISQILKNLYKYLGDIEQYTIFAKKEAGAYINLAESLEKLEKNYSKIARYYRGAGLCYQEIEKNLIECASCFILAGNYSKDPNEGAMNYLDAANTFKDLDNFEMAYKNFVKAGDMFWNADDVYQSTESYLNAYDIAVETELEFNRFGIFNQIVRGLNKVAEDGLKNKQFYTAATLILESIKFYEKLDISKDFLVREMVRNVYKYYYRAASLKRISFAHIVHSYVLAAISCILRQEYDKALEIMTEIDSKGKTINEYNELIEILIDWVSNGKKVIIDKFPFNIKRLIQGSEEIQFLLNLFERL